MEHKTQFDKGSFDMIKDASNIYHGEQIRVLVIIGKLVDLRNKLGYQISETREKTLEHSIGVLVDEMLSCYNVLECLEWLDNEFDGNLLSGTIF